VAHRNRFQLSRFLLIPPRFKGPVSSHLAQENLEAQPNVLACPQLPNYPFTKLSIASASSVPLCFKGFLRVTLPRSVTQVSTI
jgi:hypothetical protein